MPDFKQDGRVLKIDTELGQDMILLEAFNGEEAVSRPFRFELSLLSDSDKVTAKKLLRLPVAVTLAPTDDGERIIHGVVKQLVDVGRMEGFTRYRATMVPWLDFLGDSHDCRIYQEMTALDIIEKVFKDQEYNDFDIRCTRSYRTREYCVQYRESHLAFVSRLMEEEGIFYFFEHTAQKHTLVLADDKSAVKAGPQAQASIHHGTTGGYSPTISSLEIRHTAHAGKVVLDDYDHLQANTDLMTEAPGNGKEEVFDYPGRYQTPTDGKHYANVRMQATEAEEKTLRGSGGAWGLVPGHSVKVEDHYRSDINTSHQVLAVVHAAEQFGLEAADKSTADYHATWTAIPSDVQYRPPARTPRPRIRGVQTAVVVGKSGEEIWVDKHGRIKVQFHWDRIGTFDEKSSCWIRVASSWAGKGWGHIKIPRMGQEVVVEFVEGDPDYPLVTASVYNSEHATPYPLPGDQTRSGVMSRSTADGSGDTYNEFRFEDKMGSEEVYLQAEKDFNTYVKNDCSATIEHNHSRTLVEGDETIVLEKGNQSITLQKGDRSVTLEDGNETVKLANGDQTVECAAGKILIKASDEIKFEVGGSTITIDPTSITMETTDFKIDAGGKVESKSGMDTTVEAGLNLNQKSGLNAKIEAGIGLEAKGGVTATLEGGATVEVKGGGMGTFNGGGMTAVKGGIVMIN